MTVTSLGDRKGLTVVSVATDALGRATRGEVTMIAVISLYADGDVGYTISEGESSYKMVGALEHAKLAILASLD